MATAADIYFQAYLTAIQKGGGLPDPKLINRALAIPLSEKTREHLEDAIWTALDAVIGFDFMVPPTSFRSGGYMGNFRTHDLDAQEAFEIVDATRKGFVEALRNGRPQAAAESIMDFWQTNKGKGYHPNHTGRCYWHGHKEVRGFGDTLNCQMETLTRILGSWVKKPE